MAPAKPPNDDGNKDSDKEPTTPHRASAAKDSSPAAKRSGNHGGATPPNRKTAAGQTPKSAPAAGAANGGVRKSSAKKPTEPTLLGDFLLGRPSAARQAAARRRSVDAAAVRAELRQQMRQDAVRRVQQPGGVQARVKQWQKTNAAAMAKGGNPDDAATEPTEVAIHVDAESVTEEDRVRIKTRQKAKRKSSTTPNAPSLEKDEDKKDEDGEKMKGAAEPKGKLTTPADQRLKGPPKKRIVSDDNWMKRKKGNSSPKAAAAGTKPKPEPIPSPIPKDFLQKPVKPSSMQNKVKDWAMRVEIPESPTPPEIPEIPESPPSSTKRYSTKCGETITVEEVTSGRTGSARTGSGRTGDDGIRVRPIRAASPHASSDEGISIGPTKKKDPEPYDDGIRIRPIKKSPLPDDGIRVRPVEESSLDDFTERSASSRQTVREKTTRVSSARRERTPSARIKVTEEPETEVETPTRKSKSHVSSRVMRRATAPDPTPTVTETATTQTGTLSDDDNQSWTSEDTGSRDESDRPSSAPAKTLAEIPFGYSAFSELDLPVGADHHKLKRPGAQRNSSFKAVPKAFKKIVTGAKEIVHERVDPPKPVVNQPPSIESWLNGTVDPFVDKSAPKSKSLEKERKNDARRQTSAELRETQEEPTTTPSPRRSQEEASREDEENEAETPKRSAEPPHKPSVGLKRSRATRTNSSPLKQGSGKKPLRETLNSLFKGESSGHKLPTKAYSSYQDMGPDSENSYMEDNEQADIDDPHHRPTEPQRYSQSPESSYVSTDVSSNTEGPYMTPAISKRRPPPTKGRHELSTIVSGESASTLGSETASTFSETTVTQTTALSRSTAMSGRSRGHGSKRRLTKHSDLVSVLSLPDSAAASPRARSIKTTHSLRRKTSKLGKVTVDDILQEFSVDEDLYQRELKTLVDGAVPVLLNQVIHGSKDYAKDLFGPSTDGKEDSAGKAVVNMGIALEKLRNLHRWAPLHDVNRVLTWILTAYPIYDKYVDIWRLGFEGIVVNLAPAPGKLDEDDSLVNAMPRNEDGDVVDTKGQPVDLQRLLTRPLARIRGFLKLLRGAQAIGVQHPELEMTISDFTTLQEKARRRHREETARKTDEDAHNTDTSRCCDLRSLKIMEGVLIDPSRQVNAKDLFSLDVSHSSGQRLECQVELIYRDKPKDPLDKGDVLIRDTGHARFCLLFPPIPKTAVSARRGDGPGVLVVMIRGRHNGKEWYELFTLSTNLEDQVTDWLDILGTSPVPPATTRGAVEDSVPAPSPKPDVAVPLGERTGSAKLFKSQNPHLTPSRTVSATEDYPKSTTPSRYHSRHASTPTKPTTPTLDTHSPLASPSSDRTPTQESYRETSKPHPLSVLPPPAETTSLREDMRPDPQKLTKSVPNSKPYREDGAPPPPVHRTLSSDKSSRLSPPVDLGPSSRVRRRGSSPLKHEYHPSDVSSDSSESESDSAFDVESSSDELDEADVPDTQPAISIKQTSEISVSAIESVISDNSIAPSHSASQVGLYGWLGPGGAKDSYYSSRTIASISYWSNKKGQWREAWHEPCSIVITPGLIETYPLHMHSPSGPGGLNSSGSSEFGGGEDPTRTQPLIALELTPVVMIRQSTVLDLEIRSPVRPYSKLSTIDGKIFRFRAPSAAEGTVLYMAVHKARLNNAKYKALEEEARFSSFGQPQTGPQDPDGQSSSSHRHSWFSRKNSYRASTRAPSQSISQSQGTSSSISAPSLLKRLAGAGNLSFNINNSTVDRYSRSGSSGGGATSLYTSGSSSASGMTPPRSPSISLAESSAHTKVLGSDNLKIRCHLLVTPSKWEDHGNCHLQITRPPPGMRQELRIKHGMEKRVIVTKIPKKAFPGFGDPEKDKPLIVLDVVLGSKCFGRLGTRGIILNVWEDLRNEHNVVGLAPAKGGLSGKVTKWCFQCSSTMESNWIFGLVAQEVNIGL